MYPENFIEYWSQWHTREYLIQVLTELKKYADNTVFGFHNLTGVFHKLLIQHDIEYIEKFLDQLIKEHPTGDLYPLVFQESPVKDSDKEQLRLYRDWLNSQYKDQHHE